MANMLTRVRNYPIVGGASLSSLMQMPDFSTNMPQIDDSIDFSAFISAFTPMDELASAAYDISSRRMSIFPTDTSDELLCATNIMENKFCDTQDELEDQPCSCVSKVVQQLAVIAGMLENSSSLFDTQLLQLRQAINAAENSINCQCIARDQICISMDSPLRQWDFVLTENVFDSDI